jgi:Tfp pilus assembly protein PilN
MEKISINLSPRQEKIENILFRNISYYLTLGVAGVIGIMALLTIFLLLKTGMLKVYESKWVKWERQFNELSKIKKDISELENEKKEFKKVLTPQYNVAKIFEDIYSSLSQNIWFESLSFKKDKLGIRGYILKLDEDYLISLEKFINNLKKKGYFTSKFRKINIKDSQQKDFSKTKVLEFVVECEN